MKMRASMFGQGIAFPPRVGADGRLAWSVGEDHVRESMRIILLTEPGERLMREGFGCGLRRFLFEPNTAATRQLIRKRVTEAIQRWEPRVALEAVEVDPDPDNLRLVVITILFRLVATRAPGKMKLALELEG
jgi:phage baseplate assembly protein W